MKKALITLIFIFIAFWGFAQTTAEEYVNRANKKSEDKDYLGAIKDYSKAIDLDPNSEITYYNRAETKLYYLEDYGGAIQDCNKAIKLSPSFAAAYYLRGCARKEIKDYFTAIQDYSKAIELHPNYSMAYFDRASSKGFLNDNIGAIEDLTRTIEIAPNEAASAYFFRGEFKLKLKDRKGACLDWSKAGERGTKYAYEMIKKYCQ